MQYKKMTALIEMIGILLIVFLHIVPNWYNKYTTPGDLFCLEVVGLLSYNIYENLKSKVK